MARSIFISAFSPVASGWRQRLVNERLRSSPQDLPPTITTPSPSPTFFKSLRDLHRTGPLCLHLRTKLSHGGAEVCELQKGSVASSE